MNLGTTIFILVLILSIALPILFVNRKKRQKEKQFIQMLSDLAENDKCIISEYDLWNNKIIGIDPQAHKLFFIKKMTETTETKVINLLEIKKCKVVNTNRNIISKDSSQNVIDKLEITFSYPDQKSTDTILEFYSTDCDSLIINKELQLIEKWSDIVEKNISGISQEK
jgi:hypothetical protein